MGGTQQIENCFKPSGLHLNYGWVVNARVPLHMRQNTDRQKQRISQALGHLVLRIELAQQIVAHCSLVRTTDGPVVAMNGCPCQRLKVRVQPGWWQRLLVGGDGWRGKRWGSWNW